MIKKSLTVFLCCLVCFCEAHVPTPSAKENKFLIATPVLNLHEECAEESPFVSQGVYGHSALLIEYLGEGWLQVETEDGYQGYALIEGLAPDDPRWRTSSRLARVASVAGLVYPIADTERPALMELPFGARIELLKDFNADKARWLEVQLVDGRRGWMQRGDLEMPKTRTLAEMVQLAFRFLERPYIWGGSSSKGFDCSGYVQTLFKEVGVLLPRDSRPQAASDKVITLGAPQQAGDLVFFGESRIIHVGMYLGKGNFIHSGVRDNKPKTAISSLERCGYHLLAARRVKAPAFDVVVTPIPDELKAHIKLKHWGYDGCVHDGELTVHQSVVDDLVDIFRDLFAAQYPIEKMLPTSTYQGDGNLSREDNNTSASGDGLAVHINPVLNPSIQENKVVPVNGRQFLDRTLDSRGVIDEKDLCYKLFLSHGWKWGGHLDQNDYSTFYKDE